MSKLFYAFAVLAVHVLTSSPTTAESNLPVNLVTGPAFTTPAGAAHRRFLRSIHEGEDSLKPSAFSEERTALRAMAYLLKPKQKKLAAALKKSTSKHKLSVAPEKMKSIQVLGDPKNPEREWFKRLYNSKRGDPQTLRKLGQFKTEAQLSRYIKFYDDMLAKAKNVRVQTK